MFSLLFASFLGYVVYRNRTAIFFTALNTFLKLFRLYINIREYFGKDIQNGLDYKACHMIDNDVHVHEFTAMYDNKKHCLHIVSFDETPMQIHEREFEETIAAKNMIVHCSLITDKGDIFLDLTEYIRRFSYHFTKEDDTSKLQYFLKAMQEEYGVEEKHIQELSLLVYLNDDALTEKQYKLHDVWNAHFKAIIETEQGLQNK